MRMLALVALAACSGSTGTDVVGPFTGEVHRFAVDSIRVPQDSAQSDALADDLDGDGKPENQLGLVTAVLAGTNDLSLDGADMIASGALASVIEIQADELADDDAVGVTYAGADGDAATVAGGRLVAGAFRSNRTAETRAPGRALVRLPISTNADPLVLELEGLELDLDPDGAGGYDGVVRGGIREAVARDVAYAGLQQMFDDEPARHLVFQRQVDTDRDGTLTREELDNSVIALLVAADVQLFDGERYAPRAHGVPDSLSVAVAIHLVPCAAGACATGAPANHCRDRAVDADETDVDCGGSCQPCATARACGVPGDCQSNACDSGRCRAPTCGDGVADGVESDVDCGGTCAPCAIGKQCAADTDCTSGACDQGLASLGTCVAP